MTKVAGTTRPVEAGTTMVVSDTTANRGPGRAAASVTRYYLSTTATGRTPRVRLTGARKVGKLARGKTSAGPVEAGVPGAVGAGTYFLVACADDARRVREVRESNNCKVARTPLVVTAPPPLPNARPSASFDFSPGSPQAGQQVNFSSTSTDSDGTIATSAWDFDGDLDFDDATGPSAGHAFGAAGTYPVRLRVTDDDGATDIDLHNVVVSDPPPVPDPDRDDDGTPNESDCAPDDPAIHPGAADVPELTFTDSNCDGVDGDANEAIFVDNRDPDASDANPGTRALPTSTIAGGVARALAIGAGDVYVAEGTYSEAVTLAAGVSIYGGYDPVDEAHWNRGRGASATIFRAAPTNGNHTVAVSAINIGTSPGAGVKLQLLRIQAGSTTATAGSVYGVRAVNSPSLTLEGVTIEAGNGGTGAGGTLGSNGLDGPNGSNGTNGSCPDAGEAPGGNGGQRSVGGDNISGGAGGAGGSDLTLGAGGLGASGQPGAGVSGGASGAGGAGGGSAPPSNGVDGSDGLSAGDGSSGSGGSGAGSVVGSFWAGPVAGSGASGGNGGGAGGGGGGGAGSGNRGNGGGGGGAGGGGGTGGGGAGAGGGSFGLFVVNSAAGPGPTVTESVIRSGTGGFGGIGGRRGEGGTGGTGGLGATACAGVVGAGGDGGAGGAGGDGGHGGGGAGGVSYAVAAQNVNNFGTIQSENTLTPGSGGPGGPSLGDSGATGLSGSTHFF